jgi:hypothetical protein
VKPDNQRIVAAAHFERAGPEEMSGISIGIDQLQDAGERHQQ